LKWAVFSFQLYKFPGIDGIMPIMLQQGFELLAGKFLMLLRVSLALGYIPMSWKHIRVAFIPKPGKSLSQAKSLRPISVVSFILKTPEKLLDRHITDGVLVEKPLHQNQFAYRAGMSTETALFQVVYRLEKSLRSISLMSFILKTLEKLLDRHITDGVLVEKPLHQNQFAYRAGMFTETALFQVVYRLEKSLNHRDIGWVPSWTSRGHSTIPLFVQLLRLLDSVDLRRPVAGGSGPYLKADSYTLLLWAAV
jgi:nitrite reductase/ring-hydroxylating ferredoxin subunit